MSDDADVHICGRIALLNGPPSVGKTGLALSLQRAFTTPWFHRSLDDFRHGYLDRFWTEDDGTLFNRVMAGYLNAISEMARAGNDVIAEAIISPSRRKLYTSILRDLPVVLIGVHCPLSVAIRREQSRTDRLNGPIDLPPEAFAAVHAGIDYDLEVDTSNRSLDDLAFELVSRIQGLVPRAFTDYET